MQRHHAGQTPKKSLLNTPNGQCHAVLKVNQVRMKLVKHANKNLLDATIAIQALVIPHVEQIIHHSRYWHTFDSILDDRIVWPCRVRFAAKDLDGM
jgi:hypothetical protein